MKCVQVQVYRIIKIFSIRKVLWTVEVPKKTTFLQILFPGSAWCFNLKSSIWANCSSYFGKNRNLNSLENMPEENCDKLKKIKSTVQTVLLSILVASDIWFSRHLSMLCLNFPTSIVSDLYYLRHGFWPFWFLAFVAPSKCVISYLSRIGHFGFLPFVVANIFCFQHL